MALAVSRQAGVAGVRSRTPCVRVSAVLLPHKTPKTPSFAVAVSAATAVFLVRDGGERLLNGSACPSASRKATLALKADAPFSVCLSVCAQLCTTSLVDATPLLNPAFDIANPPISKNSDVMGREPNPTAEGKNSACASASLHTSPLLQRSVYQPAVCIPSSNRRSHWVQGMPDSLLPPRVCVLSRLSCLLAAASAPNTAQGAPPAAERPAAYEEALRTGVGQTNSPCPTGKIPCY